MPNVLNIKKDANFLRRTPKIMKRHELLKKLDTLLQSIVCKRNKKEITH